MYVLHHAHNALEYASCTLGTQQLLLTGVRLSAVCINRALAERRKAEHEAVQSCFTRSSTQKMSLAPLKRPPSHLLMRHIYSSATFHVSRTCAELSELRIFVTTFIIRA